MRSLSIATEHYPIAGSFAISRGSRTVASVLVCTIREKDAAGRGECVPYARYDETLETVAREIRDAAGAIEAGISRQELQRHMRPGAARNAVDSAMWDLELKTGRERRERIAPDMIFPLITAYTISMGMPEAMAEAALRASSRPLLKIKLGGADDPERMRAVRRAVPHCRLIGDANEGWTPDILERNLEAAASAGFELIEQPLPAGQDGILAEISRPVPVFADESVHTALDLAALRPLYDGINIKLDKAGGLSEALVMRREARQLGFRVMVGCMLGTSLAMAPAVLLAAGAEYVDLDGPLLLARDREPGLGYEGSLVYAPAQALWG